MGCYLEKVQSPVAYGLQKGFLRMRNVLETLVLDWLSRMYLFDFEMLVMERDRETERGIVQMIFLAWKLVDWLEVAL
jgi:hypothetical protein